MNTQINQKPFLSLPFLAGLIDGDGHIRTYKHTCEITITLDSNDIKLAAQIQNQLGGIVTKVSKKNAVRFTLNSKNILAESDSGVSELAKLINGLNGHIRNTIRVEQFKKACKAFNIAFLDPKPFNGNDGYIAGLFCTDGSIYINCRPSAKQRKEKQIEKNNLELESDTIKKPALPFSSPDALEARIQRLLTGVAPKIEVKIFSKSLVNVEDIPASLGFGTIYFAKGSQRTPGFLSGIGHYYYIRKSSEIVRFVDYMTKFKSCSIKHKRLNLVFDFYRLTSQKAHLPTAFSLDKTNWENFVREWLTDE